MTTDIRGEVVPRSTLKKLSKTEQAAVEVWRALIGKEPTKPLRTKGGALDPEGWCLRLAKAVAEGTELPPSGPDLPTPDDHPAVLAARRVLSA